METLEDLCVERLVNTLPDNVLEKIVNKTKEKFEREFRKKLLIDLNWRLKYLIEDFYVSLKNEDENKEFIDSDIPENIPADIITLSENIANHIYSIDERLFSHVKKIKRRFLIHPNVS